MYEKSAYFDYGVRFFRIIGHTLLYLLQLIAQEILQLFNVVQSRIVGANHKRERTMRSLFIEPCADQFGIGRDQMW